MPTEQEINTLCALSQAEFRSHLTEQVTTPSRAVELFRSFYDNVVESL